MLDRENLRPLERAVLSRRDEGLDIDEIAERFRRSTEHIERIIHYTRLPGRVGATDRPESELRPLERRVLRLRSEGLDHGQLAERFRRSAPHLRRVEGLAHLRKAKALLN
jgi:DNA-binding CsgD family transcriptional regulator